MNNQLDLEALSTQQLTDLLWTLKGTPQAQPLYRELSSRCTQPSIHPDDPDWEIKFAEGLNRAITHELS